jgi:hypothetical protein|tara:strand:- start:8 stop:754 length:747 start_codon:yes stop_codon:yes gene_type:complete
MAGAKEIIVKVIPSNIANAFVKKNHYSGKVVANSKLHFGCFLKNKLGGVMSFGSPLDKGKMLSLVDTNNKGKNKKWNEMLELNRMAFTDLLPRNSESRCIAISVKLIKKNAPQIKWILSFADSTQCGDGTIYRASGFKLTSIKLNNQLFELPNGMKVHKMNFETTRPTPIQNKYREKTGILSGSVTKLMKEINAVPLVGYQLRYIYLIDKKCKINVPIIPFSEIDKIGAGMYKGEKITLKERKENKRD